MNSVLSPRPDTRYLVLDSALTLFTERGYFSTSVHDIGRAAGVSIGSIYHHFGDKEGIADALFSQLSGRMEALIGEIRRRHDSAHDQARELVARLFELTESEPRAMEFMLYAKHREFLPGQGPVCSSRPFELMREMVSQGMTRGEIRPMDTMIASTCLFGGPLRMITGRLDGVITQPLPDCLEAVWDCAWRAVATTTP
ncbi:MAG: TetR/AcrR family transcriptional regulator [Pseudomonadota bacterium]|nr:TetR/AcrR family transcriptional regulator [Pseudomonadota bacterium]MDP1904989.1 TetR/AcrR family transcriptional regulator [Pseudomonadota bacterium]MDP2351122.1 TetR/AcrR family transcriptional regulator [Pseudomonadota bacterium]